MRASARECCFADNWRDRAETRGSLHAVARRHRDQELVEWQMADGKWQIEDEDEDEDDLRF